MQPVCTVEQRSVHDVLNASCVPARAVLSVSLKLGNNVACVSCRRPEEIGEWWLARRKGFNVHSWRAQCKCRHGHPQHDPVTR